MQTVQNHNEHSNSNSPRGGQASISLFGCPGADGQSHNQSHPITKPVSARLPHRFRINGALNSFDRDGLTDAHYAPPSKPVAGPQAPLAILPPSLGMTVRLRRDKVQAFVRLSQREKRPIEDVMAEWLADCAALIGRDELFEGSASAMTPAMYSAARRSDERVRNGRMGDGEAEFAHRCQGTGYVEIVLAMDS